MRLPLALALAAAMLAPDPVAAQTNVDNPPDPYVHVQTGMAFPAHIAGGTRHQVVRYSNDGADSGIGYQVARDGTMVSYLSIFVYPAPPGTIDRERVCAGLFGGIKRDILSHEPDATLQAETRETSPSPVYRATGLHAVYTGGHATFDGIDQPVREDAYLFCDAGGKWLVAYRATSPAGADAQPALRELMQAIVWPATLKR